MKFTASHTPQYTMSTSPSTLRPILDWTRNPPPPHLTAFQQFTRNVDWKSSPLGPMESWPTQLRQMVLIVMADPSPAVVYWGDGMTIVYNEAYVPLIGQKHPSLQGQDPKIGFAEIWSQFDKIIKDGRQTGQTTVDGRQFLLLQRYGFLEETYFSWKFIPVIGPEGFVIASYATVVEVTREVISDRRMGTIQTLGQHMAAAKSINEVWTRLLTGLEHNEKDIPLALLYSVEKSTCRPQSATMSSSSPQEPPQNLVCVLEGCLGVSAGHLAAPTRIDLQQDSQGFVKAFRDSMRSDGPLLLRKQDGSLSETLLSHIQWRGYGAPSNVVVVCPIRAGPSEILMGFLLLALNPRKSYDSDYQDFVHLITKQITTPHVSAVLLAEEIRQGRSAAKQAAREHAELSKQLIARTLDYEMSEAKFSRFADRVNVGFGIFDLEGQVLYANDVWYGLTSISRANKEPVSWLDGIIPEDQSIVLDIWHTLFVEKSSVKFQARFKKPWKTFSDRSGEMQVYYTVGLCNAYPDLDEDGNVKSIMSCIMDISELKWTEDQVRLRTRELDQSELQYRQFADHAPIGVCLIDPKGCLKFANDAWFEITARSREDNDCMSWLTPIHPDDVSKMEALFADLKVCKGPVTIEMRLKRLWRATGTQSTSKGSPAWILASGYTELNANGTVKNVVCWFTDISAQKAAERDLRTRMDEALEMKRQQENFIDVC
jgi:PAS domain S-box-containing protein